MDASTTAVMERPDADREAEPRFEDWVRERQDVLLRSARRMTDNHADAQDLLQTALARTFPMWEGITDKRHADAYVRRVLVNTRTSLWRARRLQEYAVATDELPERPVGDSAEQHAQRDLLLRAMRRLSDRQRRVVTLRYFEDLSTPQTAAVLQVSTGTVKSTLHRALTLMREEIRALDGDPRPAGIGIPAPAGENGRGESGTGHAGAAPGRPRNVGSRNVDTRHVPSHDGHSGNGRADGGHDDGDRTAAVLSLADSLPGRPRRDPVAERAA